MSTMLDLIDDDVSSHDSDSEDYSEDVQNIDSYRDNILKNPLNYDCHLKLIKALKCSERFVDAREARDKMNEYYPLSPELWLEWINDEKANNTDKDYINRLFVRAIEDYRSADIWFEYCQFSISYLSNMTDTRQLFETALSQVGTHLSYGYLIWGAYICYENSMLLNCDNDRSGPINEQRDRIYKLYLRQLSVPLQGNDDTLKEFLEWNGGDNLRIEEAKQKYKDSKCLLDRYVVFENQINSANVEYSANKTESDTDSKEEHWVEYLQYAEDELSKCDIINLFERAVTELCLSQSIWMRYLQYLSQHFDKDVERLLIVYRRAVRNYRSSLEIWLGLVRHMEKSDCVPDDIRRTFDSIFRESLIDREPFVPLWQAYFDFERRQLDRQLTGNGSADMNHIRQLFQRLSTAIDSYANYDPQCVLIKYLALIEARYGRDMVKARELWTRIMKTVGNGLAALWLEQVEFERRFGDFDHVKRIANVAINCRLDYPEWLFERLLRVVAEDGDLASYQQVAKKIEAQLKKINERRLSGQDAPLAAISTTVGGGGGKQQRQQKRQAPDMKSPDSTSKRVKFANDHPVKVTAAASVAPINSDAVGKDAVVEKSNAKSVYVCNLNYRVNENDLREKFGRCGSLADIRIVRDNGGKSRGFAYIQYENTADVEEALKLEHDVLIDRPMYVSRNNPDKRHAFQFAVGAVEKTKLFVKNLPKTVTKYALENIFSQYGTLKDVRIVTFKSGAPKGIAYVEFANENDASKALVNTDGMMIGDKPIEVHLSNPPAKPLTLVESPVSVEPVSRLSSSFILPRIVQKPMMTQKKLIHAARPDNSDQGNELAKKTNDDFRKYLQ